MKILLQLFIGCISFQAFANSFRDCQELRSEQLRLSLIASNLANANSTRIPEGGPYKPFVIKSCINGRCEVSKNVKAQLIKYLPGHPDSDRNGYVAYPNIDEIAEYNIFNMTAIKLKLLVSANACNSKILVDNSNKSFVLQYGTGEPNVKEDIFNISENNQVISWMRQDSKGRTTSINFNSNGKVVSHSQNN